MSAFAEEKESSSKSKAVPLEKKLDKRGLLNLGYGYGINGLDIGYIGGGHHGGAYHASAPVIESAPFAHHYGGGYGNPHQAHHQNYYLGHKTDFHKTVTHYKGYPVPYEVRVHQIFMILNQKIIFTDHQVTKHVPVEVTKHVPYHVKVDFCY